MAHLISYKDSDSRLKRYKSAVPPFLQNLQKTNNNNNNNLCFTMLTKIGYFEDRPCFTTSLWRLHGRFSF